MNIFNFLRKKVSILMQRTSTEQTNYLFKQPETEKRTTDLNIDFGINDSLSEQLNEQNFNEYVCLSTSGDENVCPICAQFDGIFFLKEKAPQLPLCPNCSCAYKYYFEDDLPADAIISNINDFILPAKCTSQFYKHQHNVYEEDDINKQIRLCEKDLKRLDEFMAPYLLGNFSAPADLVCRDLLPELYMLLGKWDKAECTIKRCVEAHAYYPNDGTAELADFESYRKVATAALTYISENPGCLQRNIYKKLPYEGMEREQLKHFLRTSLLITKEKSGNTNKLYCKTTATS